MDQCRNAGPQRRSDMDGDQAGCRGSHLYPPYQETEKNGTCNKCEDADSPQPPCIDVEDSNHTYYERATYYEKMR